MSIDLTKATPGPWVMREHVDHSGIWIESLVPNIPVRYWSTSEIATKRLWKSEEADAEFRANFHLIAAAYLLPELREMLDALIKHHRCPTTGPCLGWTQATDVLARLDEALAKGE